MRARPEGRGRVALLAPCLCSIHRQYTPAALRTPSVARTLLAAPCEPRALISWSGDLHTGLPA